MKKTAEEIYTEWFGSSFHTTKRSPSKGNIIKAMEEYASQFNPTWIDLSVSKPKPNSVVLVAIKHPNGKYTVETCHFTKNGYFSTFYNEEWFTHYMPLPEPPKEGSEL